MSEKITTLNKNFLNSKKSINEQVQALINAIQEVMEISMPLVKISYKWKPGFDQECKKMQVKAWRLRKTFNWQKTEQTLKDIK